MWTYILTVPVPDSDRDTITDKNGVALAFSSPEEAKAFRDKDDFSNVNEDHFYWLSDGYHYDKKPEDPEYWKNRTLKHCHIEVEE